MSTLQFKTNIKCGGCVATVTPVLNAITQISSWAVDTDNPDKILTIEADTQLPVSTITAALKEKGFDAVRV